jgi:hypothetical protein
MTQFWHLLFIGWRVVNPFLGFILGVTLTRWVLTPKYCPRCQYYLRWRLKSNQDNQKGHHSEPWEGT